MTDRKKKASNRLLGRPAREKSGNLKIEAYFQRLEKLEDFLDSKETFSDSELIAWITAAVTLLSEIGVSPEVVSSFMRAFEFETTRESGLGKHPRIGPFTYDYDYRGGGSGYRLPSGFFSFGHRRASQDIYYVRIAFALARSVLRREQQEEWLVSRPLINSLSSNREYSHIVSSLELLQKAFVEKNSDGLAKNSITLLDSILDLDKGLRSKGKVSKKLTVLMNDPTIRIRFGIEKEFVFALDNSRIIRNLRSAHKGKPLKYDIPFIVAVGCAYLVIILLENTVSHGELIN